MIAAFILVASVLMLLMFFVTYCRALVASSTGHVLSKEVQDLMGASSATGQDFVRLTNLLKLLPGGSVRAPLRIIRLYYEMLCCAYMIAAYLSPSLGRRVEQERAACANYVALLLERRIAFVLPPKGD